MNKLTAIILSAILSGTFISCSPAVKRYSRPNTRNYASIKTNYLERDEDKVFEEKVIRSVSLRLSVNIIDTANAQLKEIAKKHKGYASQIAGYSSIVRVKNENLEKAIKEIGALGKIYSKSIANDVFTKMEIKTHNIKLENAEKSRERYLELLTKAENVEDVQKVEKELERLSETINSLIRYIDSSNHLAEFATITIGWEEKKKPGIIGYIFLGIYRPVKWLFVRN